MVSDISLSVWVATASPKQFSKKLMESKGSLSEHPNSKLHITDEGSTIGVAEEIIFYKYVGKENVSQEYMGDSGLEKFSAKVKKSEDYGEAEVPGWKPQEGNNVKGNE